MKILVIGREGRLANYTRDGERMKAHEIRYAAPGTDDSDILAAAADTEVILVDAISPVSRQLIEGMPHLKMIHSEGVAFNRIDTEAAKERGIYVCNCKGMNAAAVAEQAILLMLGLLREVRKGDRELRAGNQIKVKEAYMLRGNLRELADCTVGLIGFGDIGQATARLLSAFGAKVFYYARTSRGSLCGADYLPLDELLKVSDIISLHLPVTPETTNMADTAFFAKMKDKSYFINTSRGELADSAALLAALRSGHLAGAGLDTIAGEPIKADNPILQAEPEVEDKILYTCHIGGITASSFARGYAMFWSDLDKLEAGGRPNHIVNGL